MHTVLPGLVLVIQSAGTLDDTANSSSSFEGDEIPSASV